MGASSSKTPEVVQSTSQPTIPTIDPTAFSYVPESIVKASQAQLQAAQQAAEQGRMAAEQAAAEAAQKASYYWSVIKGIGYFAVFAFFIIGGLYLIDYLSIKYNNKSVIGLLGVKINDATQPATVATTKQEGFMGFNESLENPGGYSISWWMFIKDWNYGYGKEKTVLEVTDSKVSNPKVSLHPTDNTLKVTIALFPNTQNLTEPAAANNDEIGEESYTCEVHDIPLQTWLPVSVSVFGRNLDVYVDGKLVKSCFLPGVPKPIVGDISLSKDGGFSGFTCDVKKTENMLNPQDVASYVAAGNPCKDQVTTTGEPSTVTSKATGYSVRFGVYDNIGKVVKEYTF